MNDQSPSGVQRKTFPDEGLPEGSVIGTRLSTIRVTSSAGEQKSVDLQPTGTGTYKGTCNVSLHDQTTGERRFISTNVTFQLVE